VVEIKINLYINFSLEKYSFSRYINNLLFSILFIKFLPPNIKDKIKNKGKKK